MYATQQEFAAVNYKLIGSQEIRWLSFVTRPLRDLKEKLQT